MTFIALGQQTHCKSRCLNQNTWNNKAEGILDVTRYTRTHFCIPTQRWWAWWTEGMFRCLFSVRRSMEHILVSSERCERTQRWIRQTQCRHRLGGGGGGWKGKGKGRRREGSSQNWIGCHRRNTWSYTLNHKSHCFCHFCLLQNSSLPLDGNIQIVCQACSVASMRSCSHGLGINQMYPTVIGGIVGFLCTMAAEFQHLPSSCDKFQHSNHWCVKKQNKTKRPPPDHAEVQHGTKTTHRPLLPWTSLVMLQYCMVTD